jgi:ABC-type sugar transport system permease subunit
MAVKSSGVTAGPRRSWGLRWYIYVAPMILALVLIFGYPIISVIKQSFYAGGPNKLVPAGWSNYSFVLKDKLFWTSVKNNIYLLGSVPIMIVLALFLSILLSEVRKGEKIYRFISFFPYIMSITVVGVTFSYLFQFNGIVNTTLRSIGLSFFAFNWLGDAQFAVPSIMSVIIWQQLGFGIILFFSQIINLPGEVSEAAQLDGVNWWQKHRFITIPQLRSVIEFFAITEFIYMLSSVFNYVYVITAGGPGNSSSVLELYIWKNGFLFRSYGMASAVSTILLLVTIVLIFIYFRIRSQNEGERA